MSTERSERSESGTGAVRVHVVRHGEVHNPEGVLYGRMPGFHLSERGREMARLVDEWSAELPLSHLRCSPLERAQETMAPIAARRPDVAVTTDNRVIESANKLEGRVFSAKATALRDPRIWWHLRNPLRPSWGEKYTEIVARMHAAIRDAAEAARAADPESERPQALIVSHQLCIWMARSAAEGRRLVHDPRKRECNLASVTTFDLLDGRIVKVGYAEPAAALYPKRTTSTFVAGS